MVRCLVGLSLVFHGFCGETALAAAWAAASISVSERKVLIWRAVVSWSTAVSMPTVVVALVVALLEAFWVLKRSSHICPCTKSSTELCLAWLLPLSRM